jgi:hypothetical protein
MHSLVRFYKTLPTLQRILIIPGLMFLIFLFIMLIRGELTSLLFILPLILSAGIAANTGREPLRAIAWVLTFYGPLGIIIILLALISFP